VIEPECDEKERWKLIKRFIVEVEYNELESNKDKNVFYDTALEVAVENLMESYKKCDSIDDVFSINVKEI
jgi:hypothetical protein